jgi:hypothetical protein
MPQRQKQASVTTPAAGEIKNLAAWANKSAESANPG